MESLHKRVESWIRDQKGKIKISWPQLSWPPWKNDREEKKRLQEEYEKRRKQLNDLCHAVRADSVSDLQDILCSMVLSECVYKRPATEMVRVVNKFKVDFGGQIVSLERVQLSLDHVPHRYLLAEAGDTLFASFIGTKQYKDVIADANILQGAIFHEDFTESIEEDGVIESDQVHGQNKKTGNLDKPLQPKANGLKPKSKPAAHRGFLARAKGIPALELYKLAQKKNQKLVLCGHSLGGAVAALATLAILRVIVSSSSSKENENEKISVKCITFSQPPVGNAALRDYVHSKGWQHYFRTYCIPEDLVPRILSPAYFHHYNAQRVQTSDGRRNGESSAKQKDEIGRSMGNQRKENDAEQLVIGVGPIQSSIWRLSKLVPLEGVWKQLDRFKGKRNEPEEISSLADSALRLTHDEVESVPQSLEIQEGSDSISLTPLSDREEGSFDDANSSHNAVKSSVDSRRWRRVPYLPSYVPFGELYLLGNSSVESLSDAEYSKLTSVRSVIAELRERFQSHSMKSYRSRFQKIYDLCMCVNSPSFLGIEQLPQFPHLQQWLGLAVAGTVELGDIVEPPIIKTATSIIPLGWSGVPGEQNVEPLKVDITGHGLHLCSLVQAQVNGNWCSTVVESLPPAPTYPSYRGAQPVLQKMRILIGAPLKRQAQHHMGKDSLIPSFISPDSDSENDNQQFNMRSFCEGESTQSEGLRGFYISCTSDFITASKEVYVRTRRVRLIGLEGAGKTSLFNAILGRGRLATPVSLESIYPDMNAQEGIAGGLCYSDSPGINLQELHSEVTHFRDELWMGVRDLRNKIDLIILVHNLSHKIPVYFLSNTSPQQPSLTLLLNEAKALGIPWVLAITNKFSVSAHQQQSAVNAVLQAYQASPGMTQVVNSCTYVTPTSANAPQSWGLTDDAGSKGKMPAQRILLAPINLIRMPFQKKEIVLRVEGVTALCQLIHRVLRSHEEASFQELAEERLLLESAKDQARAVDANRDVQGKANSLTAAAVGASLGAGVGVVLAVVMGAASALRKP